MKQLTEKAGGRLSGVDEGYIGIVWARGTGSTLEGKNKYPIMGKPLIYYPLMSVKQSRTVKNLYVFTEDDEIASTTESVGWKVIPRPKELLKYSGNGFCMEKAWETITRHVAKDLDLPLPAPNPGWFSAFNQLTGKIFSLNCNNCMLKKETFRKIHDQSIATGARTVVPAKKIDGGLMLGREDKYLYPMWYVQGLNRQEYPPVYDPLGNTFFSRWDATAPELQPTHFIEVNGIEAIDVHSKDDIDFIEFYLDRNPDYFDFQ